MGEPLSRGATGWGGQPYPDKSESNILTINAGGAKMSLGTGNR